MFSKFSSFSTTVWIALGVLVVLGVALLFISRKKVKWDTKMLSFGALSIALAFVLSYIRLWHFPQGGSITPASMLPIMLFGYVFGTVPGLIVGMAYGILQLIQEAYMLNIWQALLEFPIAFGVLGLAGMFRKHKGMGYLAAGIVLAGFLRYAAAVLAGVVFWAEYAGDQNPWVYSILYNGTYMLPETIICAVVGVLVAPPVLKVVGKN